MTRSASKVVGIIAIILSVVSAVFAAFYWLGTVVTDTPRTKHGLLFAAIFVILLLFGIISLRGTGKSTGSADTKESGDAK
jgi:hypothetical protein